MTHLQIVSQLYFNIGWVKQDVGAGSLLHADSHNICNIPYRPPYSIRHSFAAWSLLIGIEPLRLVKLMGHGSKQMVYEVYGNYLDGLEGDYWDIVNYFGKDFIEAKRKPLPFHQNFLCESLVKERGLIGVTA